MIPVRFRTFTFILFGIAALSSPASIADRRTQRSRAALLDALRVLMSERGYERLPIQNLLEHSGVARTTFYAHFGGKDALLAASVSGLRASLEQRAATRGGERLAFTLPFFEHLESHSTLYRQTVRRGEVTVGREIRAMLRELIRSDLVRQTGAGGDTSVIALTTEYLTGALWSTIAWWMGSQQPMAADAVDRTFRRLVFGGVPGTVSESR